MGLKNQIFRAGFSELCDEHCGLYIIQGGTSRTVDEENSSLTATQRVMRTRRDHQSIANDMIDGEGTSAAPRDLSQLTSDDDDSASDGDSVEVASRENAYDDGSDSDASPAPAPAETPHKLPPALRKLADTLTPGAKDVAPSSALGQDLNARPSRRSCAPLASTPRPPLPKRARKAATPETERAALAVPRATLTLTPKPPPPRAAPTPGRAPLDGFSSGSDSEDEAPPPKRAPAAPDTSADEAIARALADDPPPSIPRCLQDTLGSGISDLSAAPSHVNDHGPPRRACTRPASVAPPPAPAAPSPSPPPSPPGAAAHFSKGQKVLAQHDGGTRYYAGTVTVVSGEGFYDIHYYDDDDEKGVASSLIKHARPAFVVNFKQNGNHRGRVIEEDDDVATIRWTRVNLKAGEVETPEDLECTIAKLEENLAAAQAGRPVNDVGAPAGLFVELFSGRAVLSREMRGHGWRTVTVDDCSWDGAATPNVRCDIHKFRLTNFWPATGRRAASWCTRRCRARRGRRKRSPGTARAACSTGRVSRPRRGTRTPSSATSSRSFGT